MVPADLVGFFPVRWRKVSSSPTSACSSNSASPTALALFEQGRMGRRKCGRSSGRAEKPAVFHMEKRHQTGDEPGPDGCIGCHFIRKRLNAPVFKKNGGTGNQRRAWLHNHLLLIRSQ